MLTNDQKRKLLGVQDVLKPPDFTKWCAGRPKERGNTGKVNRLNLPCSGYRFSLLLMLLKSAHRDTFNYLHNLKFYAGHLSGNLKTKLSCAFFNRSYFHKINLYHVYTIR